MDNHGNLKLSTDFRAVYATVLQDWFGFNQENSELVLGDDWDPLQLISDPAVADVTGREPTAVPSAFVLHQNYPNPFNPADDFVFA